MFARMSSILFAFLMASSSSFIAAFFLSWVGTFRPASAGPVV